MEKSSVVRGCLLGGAIGDALGAPIEFMSLSHIQKMYGAEGVKGYVEMDDRGYITDDTQMTLFTAEGILLAQARQADPVTEVYYAYERWLKTQGIFAPRTVPPARLEEGTLVTEGKLQEQRAPGSTCIRSLCMRRETIYDPSHAINDSKGCGTVMRMAPAGLMYGPEEAFAMGRAFSALTHGHPSGYWSGAAIAMIISQVCNGVELTAAVQTTLARLEQEPQTEETVAGLRRALELAADAAVTPAAAIEELGEGWIAPEALAIAVYCAVKFADDYRAGVLAAVNISGDSDSTGAITGNLLGAKLGVEAIPAEWLEALNERDVVEDVCERILTGNVE